MSTAAGILEAAISIAVDAHNGQRDKGGQPYILHPLWVMQQMPTNELRVLAVLHDVLEDSSLTVENLHRRGIHESLTNVLAGYLTKRKGESYNNYMERVLSHPLATQVKIADLRHNLQIERLPCVTDKDLARLERYRYWLGRCLLQRWSFVEPL